MIYPLAGNLSTTKTAILLAVTGFSIHTTALFGMTHVKVACFVWEDGAYYQANGADGLTVVGSDAPEREVIGGLWYNTNNNNLYLYGRYDLGLSLAVTLL